MWSADDLRRLTAWEWIVQARAQLLPADHPDLLRAKQGLAATRYALRARGLAWKGIRTVRMPAASTTILNLRENLPSRSWIRSRHGEPEDTVTVLDARALHAALVDASRSAATSVGRSGSMWSSASRRTATDARARSYGLATVSGSFWLARSGVYLKLELS